MIQLNNTELIIRPSAIDEFFACPFKWGKTFLEGCSGTNNSRACIGTSIHRGVEIMWLDAMETGKKDTNIGKAVDAAMEEWKEITHDGVDFDQGESDLTARTEIISGTEAFMEDIAPFTEIPKAVEKRYSMAIDNPIVKGISGTVDYISHNTIADVKTSKRKIGPDGHVTQQTTYKILAEHNGENVEHNLIQGVVLKKSGAEGNIQQLHANEAQTRSRINMMLDTMDLIAKDVAPIEHILRPNPKHYLCSPKYCGQYNNCPAVKEL